MAVKRQIYRDAVQNVRHGSTVCLFLSCLDVLSRYINHCLAMVSLVTGIEAIHPGL